jgi:hypothetical protein
MTSIFIMKLMALLDSHEHDDCISWDQGGRSFTVHDAKTLMENVIPLYFKASSYPSFKRKVSIERHDGRYDFYLRKH